MLLLSRDYAVKREAFGKYLVEHSLHMRTLAELEVKAKHDECKFCKDLFALHVCVKIFFPLVFCV